MNYRQQIACRQDKISTGSIIRRDGPDVTEVFVLTPTKNTKIFDCVLVWAGPIETIPPYNMLCNMADRIVNERVGLL